MKKNNEDSKKALRYIPLLGVFCFLCAWKLLWKYRLRSWDKSRCRTTSCCTFKLQSKCPKAILRPKSQQSNRAHFYHAQTKEELFSISFLLLFPLHWHSIFAFDRMEWHRNEMLYKLRNGKLKWKWTKATSSNPQLLITICNRRCLTSHCTVVTNDNVADVVCTTKNRPKNRRRTMGKSWIGYLRSVHFLYVDFFFTFCAVSSILHFLIRTRIK